MVNFNILAFGNNPWNGSWMNRQQILSRLGVRHNIIYSQGPANLWHIDKHHFRNYPWMGEIVTQDNVFIDNPPNTFLRWQKFQIIDQFMIKLFSYRMNNIFKNKFDNHPLILYVFHPDFWPFIQYINYDFLVFHAYDSYLKQQESKNKIISFFQEQLAKSSDIIFASSQNIYENLKTYKKRNDALYFLPNGADFEQIDKAVKKKGHLPPDLKIIPEPRIGYIGSINRKVDLKLILELSKRRKNWNFIFIGPEMSNTFDENLALIFNQCKQSKNIFFLGKKNHKELPYYLAGMNVNLMCYDIKNAPWTEDGYPLKLHEYLSTGKPVISTKLDSILPFSSVVEFAESIDQWEFLIKNGIEENSTSKEAKRKKIASENTWDVRVQDIHQIFCKRLLTNGGKKINKKCEKNN